MKTDTKLKKGRKNIDMKHNHSQIAITTTLEIFMICPPFNAKKKKKICSVSISKRRI
jgi:hypothetical protein